MTKHTEHDTEGLRNRPVPTEQMIKAGVEALDASTFVDGDYVRLPSSFYRDLVDLVLRAAMSR